MLSYAYETPEEMNMSIETQALKLPQKRRLALASALLASMDDAPGQKSEAESDATLRERLRQIDAGEVKTIQGKKVFKKIDRILKS